MYTRKEAAEGLGISVELLDRMRRIVSGRQNGRVPENELDVLVHVVRLHHVRGHELTLVEAWLESHRSGIGAIEEAPGIPESWSAEDLELRHHVRELTQENRDLKQKNIRLKARRKRSTPRTRAA